MVFHIFPDSFREILYHIDYQSFMVKSKDAGRSSNQKNRKKLKKMQNRLGYFRFEGTIYIRSHIFNSRNYEKSELVYDAETDYIQA